MVSNIRRFDGYKVRIETAFHGYNASYEGWLECHPDGTCVVYNPSACNLPGNYAVSGTYHLDCVPPSWPEDEIAYTDFFGSHSHKMYTRAYRVARMDGRRVGDLGYLPLWTGLESAVTHCEKISTAKFPEGRIK